MEDSSIVSFNVSFSDYKDQEISINTVFNFLPFMPSKTWNKGDQIMVNGLKKRGFYKYSIWRYEETFAFTHDVLFEEKLESFLNQFLVYKAALLSIKHAKMDFTLSVYYSEEDLHDGFVFNQNIMRMLLDLQMDLSIYPQSRSLFKLPDKPM